MKKLMLVALLLMGVNFSSVIGQDLDSGPSLEGDLNPCNSTYPNFEDCRDYRCKDHLGLSCTIFYNGELITIWGRKAKHS